MANCRALARVALIVFLGCLAICSVALGRAPQRRKHRAGGIEVVKTTADLSKALTHLPNLHFNRTPARGIPVIHIDDRHAFQRVTGFGGTMTDSAAWLLEQNLPPPLTAKAMQALFGREGIRLRFLRLPIGASDFTKGGRPYSYDDLPPGQRDPTLRHFSIAHDQPYIIPAVRNAVAINPRIETLASPWSPPGWMKSNQALDNRHNAGHLLRSSYGPLAQYLVAFIEAYERSGIPIDDLTPQNEPGNKTAYPGLELTAHQEARLIVRYLRPALRKAHLRPRIYGHDLGFSAGVLGLGFAKKLVRSAARKLISGIAWHCYFGSPYAITRIHRMAPRLDQIGDECAPGDNPMPMPEEVISQLRNWSRVVAFWSLALDPQGGPVQPPNKGCGHCTGLITIDEKTRTFRLSPTYFELGQASLFIEPGARRLGSEHFASYGFSGGGAALDPGLDDVALRNPDGSYVLLAYNSSSSTRRFAVSWHGREFSSALTPGTTATFVWNRRVRGR
ncbi:MAG: hypothetical protein JOZ73_04475 [Solirubrobacterales bacterium]|nr:hypothetical protein [Solirubrobacterales bacterium]